MDSSVERKSKYKSYWVYNGRKVFFFMCGSLDTVIYSDDLYNNKCMKLGGILKIKLKVSYPKNKKYQHTEHVH